MCEDLVNHRHSSMTVMIFNVSAQYETCLGSCYKKCWIQVLTVCYRENDDCPFLAGSGL